LINIFGGITRCDEVAKGVVQAVNDLNITTPMVIRLVGTNQEEGRKILANSQFIPAESLIEAAEKAVIVARETIS
jgi:succinyl-CoA synthetase beta subunit